MKEVKVLAILPYEELKANVRHYADIGCAGFYQQR